jgi:Hydrolase N-terminal helical domain
VTQETKSPDTPGGVRSLGVQAAQLPKIAVDLENIAATLAEAQRTSTTLILTLDSQLQQIDSELGQAIELEKDPHLSAHDQQLLDQHITQLEDQAIGDTKATLEQAQSIRNGYSDYLQKSLTNLRTDDGYDPAPIQGIDSDDQPSRDQQDQKAVERYGANQRAKDQALVDSPGGMTPEKADAATRLRDYVTATNPAADTDARRLASERLDDFNMARFTGPLPVDPILGSDARSRAQMRLEWQKKLEQGFAGGPPMTPDQVTQMLDNSEQQGRVVVAQQAIKGLERQGMSSQGATTVVSRLSQGVPWAQIVQQDGQTLDFAGAGISEMGDSVSTGRHALDGLTPGDAKAIVKVGKIVGGIGTTAEVAVAFNDWVNGAPAGQTIGKATGGVAGGWLGASGAGALAGTTIGPEGAFIGAILGAAFGSFFGEKGGSALGGVFDK